MLMEGDARTTAEQSVLIGARKDSATYVSVLHPWDSSGKNTGVGCHFLLQGIFPNPGIKPGSLVSLAFGSGFFTTSTTWEGVH